MSVMHDKPVTQHKRFAHYISGDEQEERSFHRYKRRGDVGGPGFNSADDVYQFNATRTIFVGNIERNTNSAELKRMFERYGEIVVGYFVYIGKLN